MNERTLLDRLLEPGALSVVFQPIFHCQGALRHLHSLECLIRGPQGTNMEDPDVLLEYVRRKREESLFDRVCVATALAGAALLPTEPQLSLNVHASTLGRDRGFVSFVADYAEQQGLSFGRLTIEIVEHAPPWDVPGFQSALEEIRRRGGKIALDDIGLGQSNYKMMLEVRPDYFKIDRYFVHGAHADFYRRAVIESVAQLAQRFGAQVVAEGVEEEADLETVLSQRIELVQGYIFSTALPGQALIASRLLESALPVTNGRIVAN